jgi:hypothetical protein
LGGIAILLAACSSSSDPPANPTTTTTSTTTTTGGGSGGGTNDGLVGSFAAKYVDADPSTSTPAFTTIVGRVYDGPSPPTFQLVLDKEEAGCQLLKAKVPFCSAGCGADVCVDTDKCMPYPKAQNVGTVKVMGFGPDEVSMEPAAPAFAYQSATLPNPPCKEGSSTTLQADRFHIEGQCIAPLVLMGADPIPVKRDQPLSLTWTPAGNPSLNFSRILISLDIAHHGGKTGEIDCDVPDTGSFSIPASLVTGLVDLGLAGFPTVLVTRVNTAAAANYPKVTLASSSSVERAVDTGVKSCNEDGDCPTGQTCAADRTCK